MYYLPFLTLIQSFKHNAVINLSRTIGTTKANQAREIPFTKFGVDEINVVWESNLSTNFASKIKNR
jgi:hypothetical protein